MNLTGIRILSRFSGGFALFGALLASSCIPGDSLGDGIGSGSSAGSGSEGQFRVIRSNLPDNATWELNRVIEIEFSDRLDPDSVGFGSISFVTDDYSIPPVTGSFEFEEGSEDRIVLFRPTCPNNSDNTNGGFYPEGTQYTMVLPGQDTLSNSAIRDALGRPLALGYSRQFSTPLGQGPSLFMDDLPTPPKLIPSSGVRFPGKLNLFIDPDPNIILSFDQSLDGRSSNINLENIYILYSDVPADQVVGDVNFPSTHLIPGMVSLTDNCKERAEVSFVVAGILPPGRALRVVVRRELLDIAGNGNIEDQVWPDFALPTLEDYFDDSTTPWDVTEVVDEFTENFNDTRGLDLDAAYPMPMATTGEGYVRASFEFPGTFTSKDFFLNSGYQEIFTDGQTFFTDTNNTLFTLQDGVLSCRDFTIKSGSELRGRGDSPLVIYANGNVQIEGTLNVSGNNALWPTGLNSASRPEGGAKGECGGGTGGTSSAEMTKETPRGMTGFGAFQVPGGGGVGGEAGYNQRDQVGYANTEMANNISAGGGGGGFALTDNEAVHWHRWGSSDKMPEIDVKGHPDHNTYRHRATNPFYAGHPGADKYDIGFPEGSANPHASYVVQGAEAGNRGSSWNCLYEAGTAAGDTFPHGVYGFEDMAVDVLLLDDGSGTGTMISADGQANTFYQSAYFTFDPVWADPSDPFPFQAGHPIFGADGGSGGNSVFRNDGDTTNDFWGSRIDAAGEVTQGELLVPWAGSGGGASGDMILYNRKPDGFGGYLHINESVPDPAFPSGTIFTYRKGGPGGGGGGQLQIMAIGTIMIGVNGLILAKGGNGIAGESTGWTYGQVSGSGGGSGGHIILHSATALDLRGVNVTSIGGTIENENRTWTLTDGTLVEPNVAGLYYAEVLRAHGGRRGWAASRVNEHLPYKDYGGSAGKKDGNSTWMAGRGGAGANGVIQLHVPNPSTDILWPGYDPSGSHGSTYSNIQDYVHASYDPITEEWSGLDPDKLEEVLRCFAAPQPVVLVPFFASTSVVQSEWVDTGLAGLRAPAGATEFVDYPDYSNSLLQIQGIDTSSGRVETTVGAVSMLPDVVIGSTSMAVISAYEVVLSNASVDFSAALHFLRQPAVLEGYLFRPDSSAAVGFTIVEAEYDSSVDVLTLTTDTADGSVEFAINPGNPIWGLSPKFFQIQTENLVNQVPTSAQVFLQFQGADEVAPGENQPGVPVPGETDWTADLSILEGKRFLRWRVLFDIDFRAMSLTEGNLQTTKTEIVLEDSSEFPDEGRVKIVDEMISFAVNDKVNNTLLGCVRGLEGTTAGFYFDETPVEVISSDPNSSGGVNLSSPKPQIDRLKVPFVW